MKMNDSRSKLEVRAAEALRLALSGVSCAKLNEIRHESSPKRGKSVFTATVEVFGHCHTLACEVRSSGHPTKLRAALEELRAEVVRFGACATPILIAPFLSPVAQTMCKASSIGFLDLEGNARINFGEVFIGKRRIPVRTHKQIAVHALMISPEAPHTGVPVNLLPRTLSRAHAGVGGD